MYDLQWSLLRREKGWLLNWILIPSMSRSRTVYFLLTAKTPKYTGFWLPLFLFLAFVLVLIRLPITGSDFSRTADRKAACCVAGSCNLEGALRTSRFRITDHYLPSRFTDVIVFRMFMDVSIRMRQLPTVSYQNLDSKLSEITSHCISPRRFSSNAILQGKDYLHYNENNNAPATAELLVSPSPQSRVGNNRNVETGRLAIPIHDPFDPWICGSILHSVSSTSYTQEIHSSSFSSSLSNLISPLSIIFSIGLCFILTQAGSVHSQPESSYNKIIIKRQ
ncbi:hypothetical protein KQX54_020947 [Cotesia glomerata]|uniref:Uncharacterized protein n=1 Tax=Cotesia glomerata TaxID=32391 RepID=A0AAV7I589_COTGL|nr:hypothetical protein KQX54_020947 [Cotesia glomerata]